MTRIGIRHEDKTGWERRAPLIPQHVKSLTHAHDLIIAVQPSPQRIFDSESYQRAGATIEDNLANCDIILGVKEIPTDNVEEKRTYVFFSHTLKAQPYNMPLLKAIMDRGCTLIDYELITNDAGQRLVFFGRHAGLAGMIDTLWAWGQRLVADGKRNALERVEPAHRYQSLAEAQAVIASLAGPFREDPALRALRPAVCGFAGYGRVAQGAQEIFDLLEPRSLTPAALLAGAADDKSAAPCKVVFEEADMVAPVAANAAFDLQDYYDHPHKYTSQFSRFLPHLSVLVNCIYWEPRYPRLVTLDDVRAIYAAAPPRLLVIGDISCDVQGSIECTAKATYPDNPVYVYDIDRNEAVDGFRGRGPVVMAVEILPSELPQEASRAFSDALLPLVPGLAQAPPVVPFTNWQPPPPLKRATIVYQGRLTERFDYLQEHVDRLG